MPRNMLWIVLISLILPINVFGQEPTEINWGEIAYSTISPISTAVSIQADCETARYIDKATGKVAYARTGDVVKTADAHYFYDGCRWIELDEGVLVDGSVDVDASILKRLADLEEKVKKLTSFPVITSTPYQHSPLILGKD